MPTEVGDHTWYDEDELPSLSPVKPEDEPGYSKPAGGCKKPTEDVASILLAFGAFALMLVYMLFGADLVAAWVCYCSKCQARATMSVPGLNLAQGLAIKWLGQGGWVEVDGEWHCPKCTKKLPKRE
jgi:hypothetical protein